MAVNLRFRQAALRDLFGLYAYIVEQSGRERASAYVDRIEAACMALADFPERGTRRDDLRPGLRTLGFQRQASIVFLIDEYGVESVAFSMGAATSTPWQSSQRNNTRAPLRVLS